MATDVFYVSYGKDAEWFRWSSLCLEKNLTGHRKVILVAPIQDRAKFDPIVMARQNMEVHYVNDWPNAGYYWQQWIKMCADLFTEAEHIMHIDSDVFLKEPVKLEEYFVDGKPSWLYGKYSETAEDARAWQKPTEAAFGPGSVVANEYMQGFPFILDRRTYDLARDVLKIQHGNAVKYVHDMAAQGGMSFSEFNFMGAVAHSLQGWLYNWVDRNHAAWPSGFAKTRQFWSHAPLADNLAEIRQMVHGGDEQHIRVTNRGYWILSNDTHISRWVEETSRLDFDVPVIEKLCALIKPGDVVVDVGAFIGDHTFGYARAAHGAPGGEVFAFEPNPLAFECLRRNMAGFGHVRCINGGLGLRRQQMHVVADENAGASFLAEGGEVEVVPLDSYALQRLNFLKIDAEGMEYQILLGAGETIVRCRPKMWIEVNRGTLERAKVSADMLRSLVIGLGYRIEGWEEGPQFDILCLPA